MRDPTYLDSYRGPTAVTAERGSLLGKVFGLLAFSMAFTAVGAVVGLRLGPALALPAPIGVMFLSFSLRAGRIVLQAAAMTAALTTGLSIYGLTTGRDFSGLGPKLFFGVLVLVAASIV